MRSKIIKKDPSDMAIKFTRNHKVGKKIENLEKEGQTI